MFISFHETTFCQNLPSKVIELPHGCQLVIDPNIDLEDTVSIKILNRIKTILPKIHQLVFTDSVKIKLAISSTYVLPVWGIGSRATGDDSGEVVEIYYDPKHPNFRIDFIILSLVHEMHHVGRIRNPGFQLSLLECMVNEGLAGHFMVEVLHCEKPPMYTTLDEAQIKQNISRVNPLLLVKHEGWTNEFDVKYFNPWMFGRNGDDTIPQWTGYAIGWKIVENYLKKHPEAIASSLVWTNAKIIAGSTPELLLEP